MSVQQSSSPSWFLNGKKRIVLILVLILTLGVGYLLRERSSHILSDLLSLAGEQSRQHQMLLPNDYVLPIEFGYMGPQLINAGTIDYVQFIQVYESAGQPLTVEQQHILQHGSDELIVINRDNAYFLLNLFWAFGLTNRNSILDEGSLMQYADGDISNFASTGGWTIGAKPVTELYSSTPIRTLTSEQQARLEAVAEAVYRPCCNNHTAFADCNHGMAMLGLLEVMAAESMSVDVMFEAAKHLNAFWFPQQTDELALFFHALYGQDFVDIDARQATGATYLSSSGFGSIHQFLTDNNLLSQNNNRGSNCRV